MPYSLFLEFEDILFLSIEKNNAEDIRCYIHTETNNVDKVRKVAIKYNRNNNTISYFNGRIKRNSKHTCYSKTHYRRYLRGNVKMAWVSGTEVFKVINKDTHDEEALYRDVNKAFEYVRKETELHGKNLKVVKDTMEVWIDDDESNE